jgi:hypothetical protein
MEFPSTKLMPLAIRGATSMSKTLAEVLAANVVERQLQQPRLFSLNQA